MPFINWSVSKIDAANYCKMRYYLKYVDPDKPKPARLSAYVKGSLLHDMVENFWSRNGSEEEAAKKKNSKKYHDAKSFARYVTGKWQSIVIADENSPHKISWSSPDEKWFVRSQLESICLGLYPSLLEEGPPLFSELPFQFVVNGRNLKGRIDEVRKSGDTIIIRDYKSGRPWMGHMKLDFTPQLTLYNVAVGALCFGNEEFANLLGLEERRKMFMGNPLWVNPEFQLQFYMLDSFYARKGEPMVKQPTIHVTTRRDEHFLMLFKMIEETEMAIQSGDISPDWGRKCDSCDMKEPCEKTLDKINKPPIEERTGQMMFDYVVPSYFKATPNPIQVDQLKLKLRKKPRKKPAANQLDMPSKIA